MKIEFYRLYDDNKGLVDRILSCSLKRSIREFKQRRIRVGNIKDCFIIKEKDIMQTVLYHY